MAPVRLDRRRVALSLQEGFEIRDARARVVRRHVVVLGVDAVDAREGIVARPVQDLVLRPFAIDLEQVTMRNLVAAEQLVERDRVHLVVVIGHQPGQVAVRRVSAAERVVDRPIEAQASRAARHRGANGFDAIPPGAVDGQLLEVVAHWFVCDHAPGNRGRADGE
jgi:hypothetical protein